MTETDLKSKTQISIADIVILLTPGRYANLPGNIILVPVYLVGGTVM